MVSMLLEAVQAVGIAVLMVIGVTLWVLPDPFGKALKFWRFWRENSKHSDSELDHYPGSDP
jgi:hypothetical protein